LKKVLTANFKWPFESDQSEKCTAKIILQGTSSRGYKTDLKIVTNPWLASSCFEHPGRDVETYCPSKANNK